MLIHCLWIQIGSLMGTGDSELDSFSSHPYAEDSLSRRDSTYSKGPDFSGLFITSNSRSTDKLVPNDSFNEFPDSAIRVETAAPPPSYSSVTVSTVRLDVAYLSKPILLLQYMYCKKTILLQIQFIQ